MISHNRLLDDNRLVDDCVKNKKIFMCRTAEFIFYEKIIENFVFYLFFSMINLKLLKKSETFVKLLYS